MLGGSGSRWTPVQNRAALNKSWGSGALVVVGVQRAALCGLACRPGGGGPNPAATVSSWPMSSSARDVPMEKTPDDNELGKPRSG